MYSQLYSHPKISLCTFTATHLTLMYACTNKQAGINIHTIPNMRGTPGIEPVTTCLASVYQASTLPLEPFRHHISLGPMQARISCFIMLTEIWSMRKGKGQGPWRYYRNRNWTFSRILHVKQHFRISKSHLMLSKCFICKNAPATGPHKNKVQTLCFGVVTNLPKELISSISEKITIQ